MTREQYEHTKRRLEEQLRTGIALLQSAYDAQIHALDLVWMLHAEKGSAGPAWLETIPSAAPARLEPPSPPTRPQRRTASEIESEIGSSFWRLPESFTRRDVCEMLGYEPDRGILYRILQNLARAGYLVIESRGEGKRATVYRKTGGPGKPQDG